MTSATTIRRKRKPDWFDEVKDEAVRHDYAKPLRRAHTWADRLAPMIVLGLVLLGVAWRTV